MSGRLTISTEALARNYRRLSAATTGEVAGVIKANGYGVGIDVVVPVLTNEGCKTFFVATSVEGVRARKLSDHPIYVLAGALNHEEVKRLVESNLRPVINSEHQLALWDTRKPYALHVDTGMERLGFDFEAGVSALGKQARPPEVILTHFARADEASEDAIQMQLDKIERLRQFQIPMSVSNSAGILLHDLAEDVARAGIALYGGSPSGAVEDCLHPVVKLEGAVLQIRKPEAGTPVGYGGSYITEPGDVLATIGVGYADGVSRLLSNKGEVWSGERLDIVGRVSMDMLHVKCGDNELGPGDYIEIFGPNINVEEVALKSQTLSYEMLTGLDAARRLERVTTKALL